MDRMPDITDDSRLWDQADTVSAMRAKQVIRPFVETEQESDDE